MKRFFFVFFLLPLAAPAQINGFWLADYGVDACKYKSDQLNVFLSVYNDYNRSSGLTQEFPMKLGMSKGPYYTIGGGLHMGGAANVVVTFGQYISKTGRISARYADGSGRDISAAFRSFNGCCGLRFMAKPAFVQFDIDVLAQNCFINSWYVFPDGSQSIGLEHWLNGVYRDLNLAMGTGMSFGIHLAGPVYLTGQANYIFGVREEQGSNHVFSEHAYAKVNASQPDYLPNEMNTYLGGLGISTENGIYNDFKGFRFAAGLEIVLGKFSD